MNDRRAERPVLVFDRIDANRRNAVLLLGVSTLFVLPFAAYAAGYVATWIVLFLPALAGGEGGDPRAVVAGAVGLAVFCTVLFPFLAYRHSARLVLRVSGARPVAAAEAERLKRIVENLSIGSGVPEPRLMMLDVDAPNALSTGLAPDDATLVVTRGLLEALERRELEAVVARELSQIGNNDVLLKSVLSGVLTFMLAPLRGLRRLFGGLARSGGGRGGMVRGCLVLVGGYVTLILVSVVLSAAMMGWTVMAAVLLSLFLLLGAPVLCLVLYRTVSRERELLADADAVLLTRDPGALARALAKLDGAEPPPTPVHPALAPLFIVQPQRTDVGPWGRLLSTHPSMEERLELLRRMGAGWQEVP